MRHTSRISSDRLRRLWGRLLLVAPLCLAGAARASDEAAEPLPRVRQTEVALFAGAWSSSYAYQGGRTGNLFGAAELEGRYVYRLFAVEAQVVGQAPAASNGPMAALSVVARVGVSMERFAITAGALVSFAPRPAPTQVLPSLSASLRLGPTVASLGVFDRLAAAPARLSVEWHDLGLGWVFPLGGEVFGRLRLSPRWAVEARVLGFSLFNALTVVAVAGVVWSPEVGG